MLKYFLILLFFIQIAVKVNAEIIKKIEIVGNSKISMETMKVFGNFDIGDNISNSQMNNLIKDLYETNFFEKVEVSTDNGILLINVIENPIIQTVAINGIRSQNLVKAINEILKLKEKSSYVEFLAKEDLNLIKAVLKTQGYYFVDVESSLIKNPNDTVDLVYNIDLGKRVVINKISFNGNKIFKDRKLRNVIVSEEDHFWKFISQSKFLDSKRIELDMKLLTNYYKNKGYYSAVIKNASAIISDESEFELIFNIDAGQKFYFNNLELILPTDYNSENFKDITNLFDKLKTQTYSYNKISEILDEIDKIALTDQYEFIDASLSETIKDDKINIVIEIKETQKKYVERINILGNNITMESVIRKALIVDEGDAYNKILHNKSINALKSKNIFSSVKSNVKEGSTKNKTIIDIQVVEKPTGEIFAGAGVGSSGGTISFGIKENNFSGKGIGLNTVLAISQDSVRGIFSIINPDFNYSGRSLTTSFESTKTDKMSLYGYESSKTGFKIGTYYEQYDNIWISPTLSTFFENMTTNDNASVNNKKQEGDYFDTALDYGISYDKRNQRYQPTEGFISRFDQSLPIIADSPAIMNSYLYSTYHEIIPEMITNFSFYGKAINGIGDKDVRLSKRLYMPSSKLRGFEPGKIGPIENNNYVGGNYATSFNMSTSLPNFLKELQNTDFNFFFDAANVWGVDYDSALDGSKIRSAAGVGVDWFTPIGPLSFSLAKPITKASTDKTEGFRFNLGTTF